MALAGDCRDGGLDHGSTPFRSYNLARRRAPLMNVTMLAWVRTGTSLITFGFGVYKFFQIERKPGAEDHWIGSQGFGLILVAIGLAALALATVEYRQNMRSLQTDYLGRQSRLTVVFAGLV